MVRLDLESEASTEVPTLHVLFTRTHEESLLTRPYPSEHPSTVRQELIQWMASEGLGGDLDAAEWVLLACIAKVYVSLHNSSISFLRPSANPAIHPSSHLL